MENRRDFIKKAALASGAICAAAAITPGMAHPLKKIANKLDRVGIITNTVKAEMEENYKAALKALADIGYKCLESGVKGDSPEEYKKFIKSLGFTTCAIGGGTGKLLEDPSETIKTAELLEAPYIVTYWPWMSSAENLQMEEVMKAADYLNKIGKNIKEAGFKFAWHNHDKEFRTMENGRLPFDVLMENTDPATVTVELDWYWVVKGGYNPVDYFKKYPGRFELAHVKDMNNNRDGGITCVGNGIMDFTDIFKHADQGGVQFYIVENERAVKGMKCARESYNHIASVLKSL
ncbi:MAG: sugar phosphate isomerase/epimerase family protein [Cyclobacteriaceae bacterium]